MCKLTVMDFSLILPETPCYAITRFQIPGLCVKHNSYPHFCIPNFPRHGVVLHLTKPAVRSQAENQIKACQLFQSWDIYTILISRASSFL